MRKRIFGLAAVAILLLAVPGCGGDDSSLSRDEYDQQLEIVCNKGVQSREVLINKLTREFQEKGETTTTPEDQQENLRKLMTVYQGTTEEIRELGFPEQNPEKVEEMVRAQEEASAKVKANAGAVDLLGTTFEKPDKLAESLGVQSCTL